MPSAARAVSPSMRKSGSCWGKTRAGGAAASWGGVQSGGGGAVARGAGRWGRAVSGTLFPDGGGGDAHQEQQEAQLPEVTGKDLPRHRLLHAHQLEQDEELVEDGDPGGPPATPVRQPNQAC